MPAETEPIDPGSDVDSAAGLLAYGRHRWAFRVQCLIQHFAAQC